jgi:hypothetical protein
MESEKPIRGKSLRAAVLAVVTVLAVLVAPVCGPLCAARACGTAAAGAPSHEKCHEMDMAGKAEGARLDGHSLKQCSRGELPAALMSASKSEPLGANRRIPIADLGIVANVIALRCAGSENGRPGSRGGGLEKLEESCFTRSILRI